MVNITPRPLFTPGKDPVPLVQEAGRAPGPFWTGAEYLAPIGIPYPDRPVRSQSLYRLSYRAHKDTLVTLLLLYYKAINLRQQIEGSEIALHTYLFFPEFIVDFITLNVQMFFKLKVKKLYKIRNI